MPVSLLPFPILHLVSRFFYFGLYYIAGYRKKVVDENIRNSFPEKTIEEQKEIRKKFYKFLCDLVLETFKSFTITKKQLLHHVSCKNPEVINKFYDEGRSVIIAVGHYNSWELLLTGSNLFLKHTMVVIYQPLSNLYYDKKLIRTRAKLGTKMLAANEAKEFMMQSKELNATAFAIDQSPANPKSCYWMKFLNQDTGVRFGMEKYAKEFNQPVVYARLNFIKRGFYELEFTEVSAEPQNTIHGEITEKATKLLEKDILKKPELWLWSHKRWKLKRNPM